MITIEKVASTKTMQEISEFLASLLSHADDKGGYEVIGQDRTPHPDSRIIISLPDNILCLGSSWDKHINYALDNNQTVDVPYVMQKMSLLSRNMQPLTDKITIKLPVATA